MCGIAGLIGRPKGAVRDPLGAALKALAARGPDGSGRIEARLGPWPVYLGARRLELVEAPEGQPIQTARGGFLVFNGEIYNHEALKKDLEARGETVGPGGDAALLAALLEADGVGGLPRIEGSYAFAFLAGREGPLLLGRDPLGVRPLAFAIRPEGVALASTLDGLLAMGVIERKPDLDALVDVLRDGVIPTRRTALRGVRRVAPGEVVRFDQSLRVRTEPIPRPASLDAVGDGDVLGALRAAVQDRMGTHRYPAVFLSGGVDSALVTALAREVDPRIAAYTLTYPGITSVDERRRAKATARRLGVDHMDVACPKDPTPWVLSTAEAFDEPFADASAVPTWGLAFQAARRAQVVLTGTGGDEVFGGYRRYWLLGTGPWLRHVPPFIRAPLTQILDRNLPTGARMLRAAADPQGLYRGLLRLQPQSEVDGLIGPRLRRAAEPEPRHGPRTPEEAMADDLVTYLPDDLLVKEDRALMAHGIEGRHPFLDTRVRSAARAVEIQGSPGRGQQKKILRAFVQEVVDPDLAREPKRGFAFPVDSLYRGPLAPLAEDLFASQSLRDRGFVTPYGAMRVLRDHLRVTRNLGPVVHALVMLELWARRVLDG